MSGGFGSLDAMNKTLRNNRDLLRKKGAFEVLKENASWRSKRTRYLYKKATKEQLTNIRKKMRQAARWNIIKGIISLIISSLVVYFLISYLLTV